MRGARINELPDAVPGCHASGRCVTSDPFLEGYADASGHLHEAAPKYTRQHRGERLNNQAARASAEIREFPSLELRTNSNLVYVILTVLILFHPSPQGFWPSVSCRIP